jgi:DNA-binding transcriptional ArsR family regulator
MAEVSVEGILYAFSDPVRMQIFMQLAGASCSQNCSTFLNIKDSPLPKSTLSQHFKVLREAGLIYSERKGVELHNRTRCEELKERFGGMIDAIVEAYASQYSKKRSIKKR